MKLFNFGKQKKQESFSFLIEDVFALRNGGVVVAGRVTEGMIHQGERVVCVPGSGSPFPCVIEAIEQPDPRYQGKYLHPEYARADGPFGGHYALQIPDWHRSDFHPGDRLVPVAADVS